MASQNNKLHFLILPLMSPGHTIPLMDMAKLLAQHGASVTVVTTPLNAIRFGPALDSAIESGLPIQHLQIRFPSVEAGLPEGCENVDIIPSLELQRNFFAAIEMLQQPVEQLFGELKPSPSCIICDKYLAWTAETAQKFQIPRILFDGMSCFTHLCVDILHVSRIHERSSESEPFLIPGLPDQIELTRAQLPGLFNPGSSRKNDFREKAKAAEKGAYGVVLNTYEELEQRYVDEFRKVRGGKVWCIGPLSLCNQDNLDKAKRGNKSSIDEHQCLKWLDSWPPASVVYACLGSLIRPTPSQLIELALGLEASNNPFIWAVRAGDRAEEMEKWISEEGFEERTKGRGLIVRGWAPQLLILSHPAIGVFLSHCGWNSTLEGICGGVPIVAWPMFAEQFLNEKLIVQVLEIGTSVGAQAVMYFGEEEKAGVKVKREHVKKALDMIMDRGIEAEERRKRAKELAKMAKRAFEGGSSHLNITLLIKDIMQQAEEKP